jgi:ferric enterobactin receptor
MKTILVIVFLAFISPAKSQLSGRIIDSATGQSLSFVTVRLLHEKQVIQTVLSDSTGQYKFSSLAPGKYELQCSITGYSSSSSLLSLALGQSIQHTISLTSLTKNLAGVTVTARKPLVSSRIDGFVYDATQDVPVAGENTSDLLRKLPGVQVDPDGAPSMRGSSRIKVFIDGKPSEAYAASVVEALRLIPADNVLKIEIITQPSARYDAEGVDGVINIFTKRPLTNGSSGIVNGYVQNRNSQLNGNVIIRRRQWILSLEAGYNYFNNKTTSTITQQNNNIITQNQQKVLSNKMTNLSSGISLTWLADSLTTFSIGYRYGQGHDHVYTDIDYGTTSRLIDNPYKRTIHPLSWSFIKKTRDKSGELSVLGNRFNQHIESDYLLTQQTYRETNSNTVWNKETGVEINYIKQYRNSTILETGVKGAFRRYRNNSIFEPDNNRSQYFFFPRNIYAAYISYSFNFLKWKIRSGGRYEHTVLSLEFPGMSIKVPDYKNVLPNLLISRSFTAHTFSAGYSRKLFRPYLGQLSPVINYIDSLNINYGNPNLDPSVSNNYDLIYTYNKNRWLTSINLFLYQTLRSIESVALIKPSGVTERTYQNISENIATGLAFQLSYRTQKLAVNMNNTLRYIDFGARAGWVGGITTYATYKVTPTFTVSYFLMINTRRIDLQGSTSGTRYYNFAANKTFSDGKYAISVRIDNLFMPFQTITEISSADAFTITTNNRLIRRFFRVGFSYKFGKKEIRLPPTRAISGEN